MLGQLIEFAKTVQGFLPFAVFIILVIAALFFWAFRRGSFDQIIQNLKILTPPQFSRLAIFVLTLLFITIMVLIILSFLRIEDPKISVIVHEEGDGTLGIKNAVVTLSLSPHSVTQETDSGGNAIFFFPQRLNGKNFILNARKEGYQIRSPQDITLKDNAQFFLSLKPEISTPTPTPRAMIKDFSISSPKSGDFLLTQDFSIEGTGGQPDQNMSMSVKVIHNETSLEIFQPQGILNRTSEDIWRYDYCRLGNSSGQYTVIVDAVIAGYKRSAKITVNYNPPAIQPPTPTPTPKPPITPTPTPKRTPTPTPTPTPKRTPTPTPTPEDGLIDNFEQGITGRWYAALAGNGGFGQNEVALSVNRSPNAAEGTGALIGKFDFSKTSDSYPKATFFMVNLPVRDWTPYTRLSFKAKSLVADNLQVFIALATGTNSCWHELEDYQALSTEYQTFTFNLDQPNYKACPDYTGGQPLRDKNNVQRLHIIFMSGSQPNGSVLIDDIRLLK